MILTAASSAALKGESKLSASKMQIALFQSIDSPQYVSVWNAPVGIYSSKEPDLKYCPAGYVRVSEWIEVEFPPLESAEVIAAQVAEVNKMREKVVAEFTAKLSGIDAYLANLRAVTHQPSAEVVS